MYIKIKWDIYNVYLRTFTGIPAHNNSKFFRYVYIFQQRKSFFLNMSI